MNEKTKIDVKHPRLNDEFFGFKYYEEFFLNLLKKKKLSNAYIFHGIKGIGKATFAYRLSRCILNNNEELEKDNSLYISKDHNVFKSVAELYHPDIKVIEPENEKNKINLDQIKGLDKITYGTALESEYKIIIIDALDNFTTKNSYSTLLKLLEDCPRNSIFFLISHSISRIPKTILSRCQKIYFKPISNELLRSWFENSKLIEKKNIDFLINLSNGSLGRALSIINNNEYFDIYNQMDETIRNGNDITLDQINKSFSLFNVNLKLDEFVLIIQIVLKNYIKDLLAKKYLKNSSILKVYMSLFFEINKRINNFKLYNLDVYQTLNTIKYIFIKHSDDLKKI